MNGGEAGGFVETSGVVLRGDSTFLYRINGGPPPSSQIRSGSAIGSTTNSRIIFSAETSVGGGGMIGESRVSLDLQIRFAEQSFAPLGDYNQNGVVDAADYVLWRKTEGIQMGYDMWRANFSRTVGSGAALRPTNPLSAAVPEPGAQLLWMLALPFLRRRLRMPRMPKHQ